ncbi:cyclic pyranopterin monophosphate synthase MoaC [Acidomonas methanolica]|uniref:Molybdopterin/molybdenum cofactor biosynthesis protein MoaC n=1 Tax=Acidomonas methanolica NBRC 104435 TaxID=1231351 RepID=A0A023D246_ACIMT|nr:cyclic pyranopterin monophosphate synthase MoaC [Acidomonas methanolica]MBU2655336.1 cyclic pyranopterin monophosphate synthase MoaC [Acidomonas methanolica]TCS23753.1 cyclic pyranopterin monophosphate synthase subunit MoaC [Acidomonas methanolica]GAJ27840.1 molybdopterin/molybdenum cofactor biosynthesis protein MoaC [Acidomonas methanolica NBRC 104435]GBQ49276.1 molybdopterin biosynthesis protein MoaC [Acidomonas methanolica]GEL00224.1 cyclic pyranopterin monophosphate synthase accessory p
MTEPTLTHLDEHGERPRMVEVGGKAVTRREAHAQARLRFPPDVARILTEAGFTTKKGAVLTIAQIAGISGVKATSSLIPLCHPLQIDGCTLDIAVEGDEAIIDCRVTCTGRTGVEMEALTGASVAALTIYDMCKALTHDMEIRSVRLLGKTGGKRDVGVPP